MNKLIVVALVGLLLVSCAGLYSYKIPQLIPEDYDCEGHPGFISDSNPFPFETSQHYVNRLNKNVQKQIEEICDGKS